MGAKLHQGQWDRLRARLEGRSHEEMAFKLIMKMIRFFDR
jgi:hypothetical protein